MARAILLCFFPFSFALIPIVVIVWWPPPHCDVVKNFETPFMFHACHRSACFCCLPACDSFVGKRPSIRKNCVKMAKIQINFFCNKTIALFLSHFPITNDFFLPFSALFYYFVVCRRGFRDMLYRMYIVQCTSNSVRILIRFFPLKMPKMFSHKAMNHTEHVKKKRRRSAHTFTKADNRELEANVLILLCERISWDSVAIANSWSQSLPPPFTSTTSRNQFRFLLNFSVVTGAVVARQLACTFPPLIG